MKNIEYKPVKSKKPTIFFIGWVLVVILWGFTSAIGFMIDHGDSFIDAMLTSYKLLLDFLGFGFISLFFIMIFKKITRYRYLNIAIAITAGLLIAVPIRIWVFEFSDYVLALLNTLYFCLGGLLLIKVSEFLVMYFINNYYKKSDL